MSNNGLVVGIVMVLVFVGGFFMGRMTVDNSPSSNISSYSTSVDDNGAASNADNGGSGENTTDASGEAVNVDSSMMTDGQRKMLETMGIDPNNVKITPEVIACAEAKVGAERMQEIQNGATPSMIEGGKLFACYSSN
jgi:hypothetical protein